MPNDLPLPPDLQHLIEKRDGDERRQAENGKSDQSETAGSDEASPAVPKTERRRRIRREDDR